MTSIAPQILLLAAVVGVGVLHTIVPDHWAPITLIARQRKWTRLQTARAAFGAGSGHVITTLLLGLIVWIAGVAFATKFGHIVSLTSSIALIAFGAWIGIGSWRELRAGHHHEHGDHDHDHHDHDHDHQETGGQKSNRTALLLILGSSPMVEGLPAFFAAGKYGPGLIAVMAVLFAVSTIATYVVLCVASTAGLQRLQFGRFEEYGEVLSGGFIAAIGLVFLIFPVF